MLSDRSYMRDHPRRLAPAFLTYFLGALVLCFILQNISVLWLGYDVCARFGALDAKGLRFGHVWSLLTYALLHGNITHLLLNGLGLFFLGRALQEALGPLRLAQLTLLAALGGALAWIGVNFQRTGLLIGASGIGMAYLAVFACLYPRRPMTILLFFVIPVTLQPIWLVTLFGAMDLFGLVFKELPQNSSLYGIAHSAHLGGLAAGWLFHRYILTSPSTGNAPSIELPRWFTRQKKRPAPAYSVNLGTSPSLPASSPPRAAKAAAPSTKKPSSPVGRAPLSEEVDRILDKINLHGFASLTPAEKRVLDEARDHLNTR